MIEVKIKYKKKNDIEHEYDKAKVACKHCGHKMAMARADRLVCSWCGHYIYRTPNLEFKYKTMERINDAKRK